MSLAKKLADAIQINSQNSRSAFDVIYMTTVDLDCLRAELSIGWHSIDELMPSHRDHYMGVPVKVFDVYQTESVFDDLA